MQFSEADLDEAALQLALFNGLPYAANKVTTALCEKYGTTDPLDWLLACTEICQRFQKISGISVRLE